MIDRTLARPRDDHREGPGRHQGDRGVGGLGHNDMLMSDVLRRHELQVWFLAEHVVDVPLVTS